jgi:cysteine desulfurase
VKTARSIYLDHNATTPVDPRVVDAMAGLWGEHFGNPASHTHAYGWAAARLVADARERLAAGIGAHPEELVFTSGATEADNAAIKGVAWAAAGPGARIVTCATEHRAVLDPCRRLASQGFDVEVLPVERDGALPAERVADALTERTVLVSVMLANNETGTLQPVPAIAAACRRRGVLLHCDATQAVGKVPVDVDALGADLISISAHKIYGPKGVGALVVRRRRPRLRLVPLLDGGGHEQGMRSGTLNVPGIVGFARALELCVADLASETERLRTLRDRLHERIAAALPAVTLNGHAQQRLPNTANLAFAGVDGPALIASLGGLAVSSGSACTSADPSPSHVLLAMGLSRQLAAASLRFSLGRGTSGEDVDVAADIVVREVRRLRDGSPLWTG